MESGASATHRADDPPPTADSPIDMAAALARLGGNRQLLLDLVGFFFEDSPSLLRAIEEGVARQDWDRVHRAAHSLKGLAANFNAEPCVRALAALESSCAAQAVANVSQLVRDVDQELARLTAVLASYAPRDAADA
ncbi:MAG: Hpt domain-containing protein [Planctomycetia bacterium]|nr:Hpt domain-containing protein [Planctomycetia bacterium]